LRIATSGAFKTKGDDIGSNAFILKLDSTGKESGVLIMAAFMAFPILIPLLILVLVLDVSTRIIVSL